jgi:hypothetical protein
MIEGFTRSTNFYFLFPLSFSIIPSSDHRTKGNAAFAANWKGCLLANVAYDMRISSTETVGGVFSLFFFFFD